MGGDGILALARLARLARGAAAASPQRAAGGGGSRGSWHQAWLQAQGEEWLPGSGWRSVPAESRRGRLGSARSESPGCGPLSCLPSPSPRSAVPAEDAEAARTDRPRGAARTCGTDGAGGGARPPPLGRGQPCAPRARRGGTGGAAASQPHLTLAAAQAGGRRRGPSGSRAPHEVSPSWRGWSPSPQSASLRHPQTLLRRRRVGSGDTRGDPGTGLSQDGKAGQVGGNATGK